MILIRKGKGPQELSEYCATPGATYSGMGADVKRAIRERLLREQGHLCAYCMRRIAPENTQIEHYIPRHQSGTRHQDTDLQYGNMLGVCPGNKGNPPKDQTCDNKRGNAPLAANPLQTGTIDTIGYRKDGKIYSSNPEIDRDLDEKLNLNHALLQENRKKALSALEKKLHNKIPDKSWRTLAKKYRDQLIAADKKQEYVGILLWYLDRKIPK